MGLCFALKHQQCYGEKFNPSLISLKVLKELWFQQEFEDAYDDKVAFNTWPTGDCHNHTASADLIEQHFCQIHGIDEAHCSCLMRKILIPPTVTNCSDEQAKMFNKQMI